jgi:hypothetical protein
MRFRMRDRGAGAALMVMVWRGKDRFGRIRHRSVILMVELAGSKSAHARHAPWGSRKRDGSNVTIPWFFMLRRNTKRRRVRRTSPSLCEFQRRGQARQQNHLSFNQPSSLNWGLSC